MSDPKTKARFAVIIAGCLVMAGPLLFGCGEDDPVTPPPQKSSPYKNLQNKDDILFNLELAYNKRDFEQFEMLLDSNFVFVLSERDYNAGEVDVPQWDRVRELNANQKILDPNLEGDLRVLRIDLTLDYSAGNWAPQPPDTVHPTETWYTKTVDYDLVVNTADNWEHRALGFKAEFTIRQDDATGRWQIVLWADDVRNPLALSPGREIVDDTTWGRIKSLYS
jgi:hypothetical protein